MRRVRLSSLGKSYERDSSLQEQQTLRRARITDLRTLEALANTARSCSRSAGCGRRAGRRNGLSEISLATIHIVCLPYEGRNEKREHKQRTTRGVANLQPTPETTTRISAQAMWQRSSLGVHQLSRFQYTRCSRIRRSTHDQ